MDQRQCGQSQKHWKGIQEELEPLMAQYRVGRRGTLTKLDKAKNNSPLLQFVSFGTMKDFVENLLTVIRTNTV